MSLVGEMVIMQKTCLLMALEGGVILQGMAPWVPT